MMGDSERGRGSARCNSGLTPASGGTASEPAECSSRSKIKRKQVLNEIYETEKTFQHNLMLLTTLFLEPVKVSSILPPKVIEGMFSNIEAIQSVSSHLVSLMEEHGVVHALLELAPYLKLYSVYANNFNSASKLLEELQNRSEDFKRLLKFQEAREEMEGLKLNSLLLTPIQRVPRYRLLLENLLKLTDAEDGNHTKLKVAYEEIANVTAHINECVRQHENFNRMLTIQNSFVGPKVPQILQPGRRFIRQGVLSKLSQKKKGKSLGKELCVFLFNDMLVYGKKQSSDTYQCCDVFALINCVVELSPSKSHQLEEQTFFVRCGDKSVWLCGSNEASTTSWVDDIKKAIRELHGNLASLKRCDGSTPISPHKMILKNKGKTTLASPSSLFKWKSSGSYVGESGSPLFKDISNLTPTKRNTIVVEPALSVFDIHKICEEEETEVSQSFANWDTNNNNNTTTSSNTSSSESELCELHEEECMNNYDAGRTMVAAGSDSIINWTVTEKGGGMFNEKTTPALLVDENCCCVRKRKENNNITAPYVKKKLKLERAEEFSSLCESTDSSSVLVTSPEKSSAADDSSGSCALM